MIRKTGSARWEGRLRDGKGTVNSQSGALRGLPYSFATRFEGLSGTNPEEMIAAAHASCFSMALAGALEAAGLSPRSVETTAEVTLEKQEAGFTITRSHLVTAIKADGAKDAILAAADKAKATCPISRLLRAEITLEARVL